MRIPVHAQCRLTRGAPALRPSVPHAFIIAMSKVSLSRWLLLALAILAVLLCAFTASALIDWQPHAHGLPSDISAIQQPDQRPLTGPPRLPKTIKPEDIPLN
jgi:hypothetical protein